MDNQFIISGKSGFHLPEISNTAVLVELFMAEKDGFHDDAIMVLQVKHSFETSSEIGIFESMKLNRLLIFAGFLAILYACDTETYYHTTFETDDSADFWTVVGWNDDSTTCYVYSMDTTLTYDNARLFFYKDRSTLKSFPKKVWELVDTEDGSLDSVQVIEQDFTIAQSDQRVKENDSILVIFLQGKKKVKEQVLYKENSKSTFWDRAPLPKLH